jgi:serine/threonine protein kinase
MPVPQSHYIKIHDINYLCLTTLFSASDISVYVINYLNKNRAVKVANSRYSKSMLEHEKKNYNLISGITEFNEYMVPMIEVKENTMVVMELGYALTNYIEDILAEPPETLPKVGNVITVQKIELLYRQAFQAIKSLHENSWCHLDIRPGNLIMYHNKVCLIDWTTACHIDNVPLFKMGHDESNMFWPTESPSFLEKKPRNWDLFGLSYCFVFWGLNVEGRSRMLRGNDRDVLLMEILSQPEIYPIAIYGARLEAVLKRIGHAVSTTDYHQLEVETFGSL